MVQKNLQNNQQTIKFAETKHIIIILEVHGLKFLIQRYGKTKSTYMLPTRNLFHCERQTKSAGSEKMGHGKENPK